MNKKRILPIIISTLGGFLFGYDTGVINGRSYFLKIISIFLPQSKVGRLVMH